MFIEHVIISYHCLRKGFPDGSVVKNLPAMQKMWFWSLGWEDLLEKEKTTHSSIAAWGIRWKEEPGGLQSMASQRVRHDLATDFYLLKNCLRKCFSRKVSMKWKSFGGQKMQDDSEVLSALRERPNGATGFLPTRIWEAASPSALFCSSAALGARVYTKAGYQQEVTDRNGWQQR